MIDRTSQEAFDLALNNSWLEINQAALSANAAAIRSLLNPGNAPPAELMAVVKADGYGHGALNAAKAFREGGATWFGVTSVAEAKELVDGGINSSSTPILVFAPPVTHEQAVYVASANLHTTVCDIGHVRTMASAAKEAGATVNVHLKVDTGMSRLGLPPDGAREVVSEIEKYPFLRLTGVYTHFATANEKDLKRTLTQLRMFNEFSAGLKATTGKILRHCANSSALLRLPDSHFDLVRAGTVLYGQLPSQFVPKVSGLRTDTWELKSRVVFVHELPIGAQVGYGAEVTTKRATTAAVIALGYADGIAMQPASLTAGVRGIKPLAASIFANRPLKVKFGEFRAPVIGRIAMQMMVVDVTDSPKLIVAGDIASVPARRLAVSSAIPKVVVSS